MKLAEMPIESQMLLDWVDVIRKAKVVEVLWNRITTMTPEENYANGAYISIHYKSGKELTLVFHQLVWRCIGVSKLSKYICHELIDQFEAWRPYYVDEIVWLQITFGPGVEPYVWKA